MLPTFRAISAMLHTENRAVQKYIFTSGEIRVEAGAELDQGGEAAI